MLSLDSLPADVQYNILSWLICPLVGHDIQRAPQTQEALNKADVDRLPLPPYANGKKWGNHPYLCLAAANRSLRVSVEDYCHHLVNVRLVTSIKAKRILAPTFTNWSTDVAKLAAKKKKAGSAELRSYRVQYVRWSSESCLFCGKKSVRRAVFNLQMWCCQTCDDKEFGSKISKSEAMRRYKLKEMHFTFPHILWPDLYTEGLQFAYANLPVFQGALMLRDADLRKLSEVFKKNPPTKKQMRELKVKSEQADLAMTNIQALKFDREVIQKLTSLLERFLNGRFEIPCKAETIYHLHSTMRDCMWKLRYNLNRLFQWQRVAAWWMHMLPPSLAEHFKLTTEPGPGEGEVDHQIRVRTVPFPGAPVGEDGVYWAGCFMTREFPNTDNGLVLWLSPYEEDRRKVQGLPLWSPIPESRPTFGVAADDSGDATVTHTCD